VVLFNASGPAAVAMIDSGLEYMRPLVAVGTFLHGAGPIARALNGARATPGAFTSSASFFPFPILSTFSSLK
jgi:hypothetical protein